MDELIQLVDKIIAGEYYRAALEHGRINHSDHQSYAVSLEEFEEALFEVECTATALDRFWTLVKTDAHNAAKLESLDALNRKAMLAACELIQVAATARKAALTIRERGEGK